MRESCPGKALHGKTCGVARTKNSPNVWTNARARKENIMNAKSCTSQKTANEGFAGARVPFSCSVFQPCLGPASHKQRQCQWRRLGGLSGRRGRHQESRGNSIHERYSLVVAQERQRKDSAVARARSSCSLPEGNSQSSRLLRQRTAQVAIGNIKTAKKPGTNASEKQL
jgi:hypothetical protein